MSSVKITLNNSVVQISTAEAIPMRQTYSAEREKIIVSSAWKIAALMLFVVSLGLLYTIKLSLRLDESQSLWQISRSVPALLETVAQDVHVPLYHLILHFWQIFFGNSVESARIISLIFFTATVPVVYLLGKEAYGTKIALFSATLAAVSPFLNWYGVEIRMYSMLVFITVLHQYFFVRLLKKDSPGIWLGYALTALFGMYTHYFFFLSLLTEAIFFFSHRKLFSPKALRNFIIIFSLLGIAFLPWIFLVVSLGLASTSQPLLSHPTAFNLFDTFVQFIFGFQTIHLDAVLVALWPVLIVLAFFGLRRDRRSGTRRGIPAYTSYFLSSFLLPILIVFFLSSLRPVFLSRYLILTIPPLYLFLGWIISTFPSELAKLTRAGLIAAMVLSLMSQSISHATPIKEDYKAAVAYLQEHATNRDVIVVAPPFTIYPLEYYYKGSSSIATLPPWDRFKHGPVPPFSAADLPNQVKEIDNEHQIAWVLLSFDQGYNENIRLFYETHFQRIDHQDFSPGLSLYAYKLRY